MEQKPVVKLNLARGEKIQFSSPVDLVQVVSSMTPETRPDLSKISTGYKVLVSTKVKNQGVKIQPRVFSRERTQGFSLGQTFKGGKL